MDHAPDKSHITGTAEGSLSSLAVDEPQRLQQALARQLELERQIEELRNANRELEAVA